MRTPVCRGAPVLLYQSITVMYPSNGCHPHNIQYSAGPQDQPDIRQKLSDLRCSIKTARLCQDTVVDLQGEIF